MLVNVDVDVDVELCDFSTDELISELLYRKERIPSRRTVMENVYWALRDKDFEKVTNLLNPVIEYEIGKRV